MKLEPIIQSEASQKEKHQYSMLMHVEKDAKNFQYSIILKWKVVS